MPRDAFRRLFRPFLACVALSPLGGLPAAGAEWSRSVTVHPEVLAALPASGPVPALAPQRSPSPAAANVEFRWELLAELGPAPRAGGSWAAGGLSVADGAAVLGKAAPALIRPGQAPQWVVGTGVR